MKSRIGALALMLAFGAGSLPAQSNTGTAVGEFLLIEPSARIAAMGNAGATVTGELLSAYYNPAAIGLLPGSGVQVTHSPWLAGTRFDYVGAALMLGEFGNLYVSVTSLNSGEIDVRTVNQPLGTGERYSVSDLSFGLGYGRRVSDRFSLGLQANYIGENIWHSSMTAFAFNIGTLYQVSTDGLRIGASVSNWGTRAKFDGRDLRILYDQDIEKYGDNRALPAELYTDDFPLPILFRVGLGLPVSIGEDHKLYFAVDAFHPSDNKESISFGMEWTFFDTFSLRGGYQNAFLTDSEVGLTIGAGLRYGVDNVNGFFDYAWADHGRLEATHRFTLGVLF